MFYFIFAGGIFIFISAIYIVIKADKVKDDPGLYKQHKKIARLTFLISLGFFAFSFILYFDRPVDTQPIVQPATLEWTLKTDENLSEEVLISVIRAFEEKCMGFRDYFNTIEKLEIAVYKNNISYQAKSFGWDTDVTLNVTIKTDADLPDSLLRCAGNTLYYFVGGGATPGIDMMKDESALFFGLQEGQFVSGKNTFIPDSAFQIVDGIILEEGL